MSDAFTPRALASVTPKKKPITVWEAADRIEALEAKLAKAVGALERAKASIENGGGGGVVDVVWLDDPCPETLCDFIAATLAEIKGESHD